MFMEAKHVQCYEPKIFKPIIVRDYFYLSLNQFRNELQYQAVTLQAQLFSLISPKLLQTFSGL